MGNRYNRCIPWFWSQVAGCFTCYWIMYLDYIHAHTYACTYTYMYTNIYMQIYVYVCMHVYECIMCLCVCIYMSVYMFVQVCVNVHIQVCVYVCAYMPMCIYVCTWLLHIHAHRGVYVCMYMSVYLCICLYVYMCVYVYICVCVCVLQFCSDLKTYLLLSLAVFIYSKPQCICILWGENYAFFLNHCGRYIIKYKYIANVFGNQVLCLSLCNEAASVTCIY